MGAEVRLIEPGLDSARDYTGIKMKLTPMGDVSRNSTIVTAQIPKELLKSPVTEFWIHALNSEGQSNDSGPISIGVKPVQLVESHQVSVEVDTKSIIAQGTQYTPTVFVNNNNGESVYGSVMLFVNGKEVSSVPKLLEPGLNEVKLQWIVPKMSTASKYEIMAAVNLYGEYHNTSSGVLETYPKTISVSLSEPSVHLKMITDGDGKSIARPALIYASKTSDMPRDLRFKVVAPDGTCVIGDRNECLISESTAANRGGLESVTIGSQIFRVKYSGHENPLERFSITSFDPIIGNWSVGFESDSESTLHAYAEKDASLKIKYRGENAHVKTIPPLR